MDNRDYSIRCPYYKPGKHTPRTQYGRVMREKTIICQGGSIRHRNEFPSADARRCYRRLYCEAGYEICPMFNMITEMGEEK